MPVKHSISSLEHIIQDLIQDLEKYAHRENASQIYIDKQNLLIRNLLSIHESMSSMKFLEIWQSIDKEIQRLEKVDGQLNGHSIYLHCRPNGHNFSRITYNPF